MKEGTSVIDFYERDAKNYDEKRFVTDRGKYGDEAQKDIVFSLSSWKNLTILDVGCGTGRFSFEALRWGSTVTALDPSRSMLEEIKRKMDAKNKIRLIRGSGQKVPFTDDTFDRCISINVLNHLQDCKKVFTEIHRILKPNAIFIFNFSNLHSPLLPAGLLVNLRKESLINPVYTKWHTLKEIESNLQTAGFEIEIIEGILIPAINPIPLQAIKKLNEFSKNPTLKHISTGIFVKAIAKKG